MPWSIQQSGSTGYLQTPVGLKFVSGDDWVFRFALQQASNAFFRVLGEPSTTQSRIYINPTGLILRLEFASGGSYVDFTLPSGFSIATRRDFVLSKSGTSYTLEIDGAAPITGVLFGSSRAWGSASTNFFRSSNTTMSDGALYYFEFEKNGVIQNSYLNTTGTGTSWTDTADGNNATQVGTWPADDREWVFYSTGESLTFSGTLPKLTAAISANVASGISASFSGSLPKLQASINANISTGTDSLSFSGKLPKLTASISATVSGAPNSLYFSGVLPKLRASIDAAVSLPPPLVAFSGILPRLRMQVAMIIPMPQPAGDPLALKQALVNARRAEENRNNEYVPPVVIVPDWYIIQQRALGLKQSEANRARDEE